MTLAEAYAAMYRRKAVTRDGETSLRLPPSDCIQIDARRKFPPRKLIIMVDDEPVEKEEWCIWSKLMREEVREELTRQEAKAHIARHISQYRDRAARGFTPLIESRDRDDLPEHFPWLPSAEDRSAEDWRHM